TPEEEKGYWFHAYQPEDLCTIHNPMGDLQDFIALVKDAKKFGIDIIPDYTFNFMGIGGSGKNDLDYPSADIRAKISKDIDTKFFSIFNQCDKILQISHWIMDG
ncbi:alpha-amylase family glycosyl hydrolase, partial [Escherichia coli]